MESIEEVQQGSLNKDDSPQESSSHVSHAQTKKGFRRKKVKTLLKFRQTLK